MLECQLYQKDLGMHVAKPKSPAPLFADPRATPAPDALVSSTLGSIPPSTSEALVSPLTPIDDLFRQFMQA